MKNLHLSTGNPITILGIITLILTSLILAFFLNSRSKNISSLELLARKNKFILSFNLQKRDQDNFSQILEKLNLQQSIKDGIEFELDATSSTKLSFVTPAQAKLRVDPKEISYKGSISRSPFSQDLSIDNLKLPDSANLAVFGPDFKAFLKTKYTFPKEVATWIDNNLTSSNGQYLIIFGQDANTALLSQAKETNFDSLKNLRSEDQQPIYKEETQENVNFHLINLPKDSKKITVTFFQIGEWLYFVSSYQMAQEILKSQKSLSTAANFPKLPQDQTASLVILFRNTDQNPLTESFYNLLLDQKKENVKFLEKIEKFEFILKGNKFSGLINIK